MELKTHNVSPLRKSLISHMPRQWNLQDFVIDSELSIQDDAIINGVLLKLIPQSFCFDGIENVFKLEEDAYQIAMSAIIWCLRGGASFTAAMQLNIKLEENKLRYDLSLTPEMACGGADKLWKTFYLFVSSDVDNWTWEFEHAGLFTD
ncbi:hypothetical protein [Marinicella sp. W31]|uniref:hypothetical protein n=1 Tax=Marinicella sp. W31 TaxID=3023713 RepID=UPI0037572910